MRPEATVALVLAALPDMAEEVRDGLLVHARGQADGVALPLAVALAVLAEDEESTGG